MILFDFTGNFKYHILIFFTGICHMGGKMMKTRELLKMLVAFLLL